MNQLLQSDHFTIQSKIKWFPSLTTKYQIVDDEGEQIGKIHFHPVLMAPILWFFGILLELGMVIGGFYLILQGENNAKYLGAAILAMGAFLLLVIKFRTFLSTRASSFVEVLDSKNESILSARKGWALFRPTFTVKKTKENKVIGESKQSFLWGDCHYTLWDEEGNTWGSIRRRIWGFQYRAFKGSNQVARFRKKLIDARKLITGLRSYTLEYETDELSEDERALLLGTIAYVDVLTRQKKLRSDKKSEEKTSATKNQN